MFHDQVLLAAHQNVEVRAFSLLYRPLWRFFVFSRRHGHLLMAQVSSPGHPISTFM